ncbi:MAG: hypothetical protein M3Y60_14440 [Bacteroidota bacterium]|nr:hypothetical protein [Bacteroidota bacterium]
MDNIRLGKPYKVQEHKHKQYQKHYEIPVETCVVIPVKKYGDQISCDLRWKDEAGETNHREDLMFSEVYLQPLDAMKDFKLYELWEDYTKTMQTPLDA